LVLTSANAEAQNLPSTLPDFNFFRLDKTPFTNKNLATGKPILLVFFDAECDHCQQAVDTYNKHYQELKKIPVYLITLDNKETIKRFMAKYGNNLYGSRNVTVLQDLKNEFLPKFRPRKYPSMYLYSSAKKLLLYDDEPKNIGNFLKKIKANS
jgi:cytochrome oxidase Cu insertion factor (SCO1/SenC/PrrC family)